MNVLNLEKDILTFMTFYRKNFPNATILPKMHIMEDHTVPWLRRWRIGSGLMGEQGAEAIHAHMNSLDRTHRHIPDEVARLKYIFKEQLLESDPSLTALRPSPSRKRKHSPDNLEE